MFEAVTFVIALFILSFGFVVFFGAPYVPTMKKQVAQIMKIRPLKKGDVFVDIGSGDGIVLRSAAKTGARAIGYELSPYLWLVSKIACKGQKNIDIRFGNFWPVELPADTTVVYTFLSSRHMPKLHQKLQKHVDKNGQPISFISYGFQIKDREAKKKLGPMYLYDIEPQLQT